MPDQNPIYDFLKSNKLTDLDEKSFVNKYSAPDKAKEIYSFFVENELTDLDNSGFYDKYLKKKDQKQEVLPSVYSPAKSQLALPDFEKGKAFAEKGFLMQPEGTKSPKEQEIEKQGLLLNTVSALDKGFYKNFISSPIKGLGTVLQGATKKVLGGTGEGFVSNKLIQFGDYLNKTIDELTPQDEEFKGTLTDQVAQAFGQVGSVIATGGIAGAGKGAAAALVSEVPKGAVATAAKAIGSQLASPTAVSAGLSMGQAEFDRAIESGATDDQAFEAFYKNAATGSVLETIPVMQFFKRFNNTTGGSVANYIKTKGVAGLTGGIEEMTTEVLQQIYSNKTAKDLYNINQDILDGVGTSGGIGFGVGFVLNAMGANAKILRKQGKEKEADVLDNQIKQYEDNLENPKITSDKKTFAKDIVTQGVEIGTQKAVKSLDRDLANNVITPEQYQEGIVFAEKAAQVVDKIPETITGESRVKSMELLVERNDIKQANQILLQQKQTTDEAYHAGIDEEIKSNEERIKKLDTEVYNIAKKPSKEFGTKTYVVDGEEVSQEAFEALQGKPIGAKKIIKEIDELTIKTKPTQKTIPVIDERGEVEFAYNVPVSDERTFITRKDYEAEVNEKVGWKSLEQPVEVKKEVKPTEVEVSEEEVKPTTPTLEEEYNSKSVDELIALKKKLYPSPDIETPMTKEEKLLDRVIAKKFSDKQQEIIEKRKITEEAPRFPSYDDAQEWIKSKSKEYKSKNEFLASQEYKDALPDINALFKVEKADYSKKAKAAMQESGVKIGDRVMYDYVTPIGVETYSGQIVDRQGVPFVRFDNDQKTISGKQSVRWHKGFIKESAPKSVVEQVKPTEVKEEVVIKNITPENIEDKLKYIEFDVTDNDNGGVKDIHHGSDVYKTGSTIVRNNINYPTYAIIGRNESNYFEFIINNKGEIIPLNKDVVKIKQLGKNEIDVKNTAKKLKDIADSRQPKGKIDEKTYQLYNDIEKMVGRFDYTKNKWEDVAKFYHKALKDGSNPELVKMVGDYLEGTYTPKEPKVYNAKDLKKNPKILKEDEDNNTITYPRSFVRLATNMLALKSAGHENAKIGDVINIFKKDYVIEDFLENKKNPNETKVGLIRVDKDGNILRERDLSKKEQKEGKAKEFEEEEDVEVEEEAEQITKDDLKKAEAKFAAAEDKFKKARNKIEATQVKQAGMFGGEQKGMFAMGGTEAKSTLDPLRKAAKEAKAELDNIKNRIKVQEEAQPELAPIEAPKKTYQEAVKEKIEADKKQNRQIGAEKATVTKEIYRRVNQMDAPVDAEQVALRYLADGGTVSKEAVDEAYGSVKRAELNVKRRVSLSEEVKSKDFVKGNETLDDLAHRLWEANDQKIPEDKIKDKLMAEIGNNNTRLEAAEAYLDKYNAEYKLEKEEMRMAELYKEQYLEEQAEIEKELRTPLDEQIEGEASEEHINNLINQYEAEIKGEDQQLRPASEREANKEAGKRKVAEKNETELAKDYKEVIGKAGKKAKENAKKEFVERNFDNIVEKLKIQIKCPT